MSFIVLLILPVQITAVQITAKTSVSEKQLSDPTKPGNTPERVLVESAEAKAVFNLSAIFTRNNKRYAIIDGKALQSGDTIADMQIREIKDSRVVLQNKDDVNTQIELKLLGIVDVKKQVVK